MKDQTRVFNRNLISAAALVLLAVLIWIRSSQFPDLEEGYPGPKLFPRIIALGLGLIGLSLGVDHFRKKIATAKITAGIEEEPADKSPLRLGLGVLFIAGFPLLSPLIGFIPTLLIIGVLMGLTLQLVWWKAGLTAAITTGVIYLIFSVLLNVPL